MIGIYWWIRRIPGLSALLGEAVAYRPLVFRSVRALAGWGRRPSYHLAAKIARRRGLPCLTLEDGFLRSWGLGVTGAPPLSLIVDAHGIYYDASQSSDLELIIEGLSLDEGERLVAQRAMALIQAHGLSKYNFAPDMSPDRLPAGPKVLVVDQTAGDLALVLGGANAQTFARMLDAAREENPGATIIVKTHPDVICGKKQGHYGKGGTPAGVLFFSDDVSPCSLLATVDKVYVATSQMGFEALIQGKLVVTFGLPWYAGWGCTDDRHPEIAVLRSRRSRCRTVEELFFAAYVRYCRYLNPESGTRGSILDVIGALAAARARARFLDGRIICVGVQRWKRVHLIPFLDNGRNCLEFVNDISRARALRPRTGDRIAIWGHRLHAQALALCNESGAGLLTIEDGFLRSVGLGSDFFRPSSLVLDDSFGIYYDATRPSRLEKILSEHQFSVAELERAATIRAILVRSRITKYNVGLDDALTLPPDATGRKVILVPGQVENDASIRFGRVSVSGNQGLLEAVRAQNPGAYIIYKPHPDVLSGNRRGRVAMVQARQVADLVEHKASIVSCIAAADEVHTMTSLAGFDALVRGTPVVTYGMPFYAGWGLTEDQVVCPRRGRRLSLDELVAGALILYPHYLSLSDLRWCGCERTVVELAARRDATNFGLKLISRARAVLGGMLIGQAVRGLMLIRWWLWRG